jgi:hypothetical protein
VWRPLSIGNRIICCWLPLWVASPHFHRLRPVSPVTMRDRLETGTKRISVGQTFAQSTQQHFLLLIYSSLVPTICGSQPRGPAGQTDTILLKGSVITGGNISNGVSIWRFTELSQGPPYALGVSCPREPRGGVRPGGNEPMFPPHLRRQDVSFSPYLLHILTRTPVVPCDLSHNNYTIQTTHLKSDHATNS